MRPRILRIALVGTVIVTSGAAALVFSLQYRFPQPSAAIAARSIAAVPDELTWRNVGGDDGHQRFSRLDQVNRANVRGWCVPGNTAQVNECGEVTGATGAQSRKLRQSLSATRLFSALLSIASLR
jgi:glucose dehydrogenase